MGMRRYTVRAERRGRWWSLQAVEAPGAISQVVRLDQADRIREAIAFVEMIPAEEIEIDVMPVLPPGVTEQVDAARRLRREARETSTRATHELRLAARALADAGLTLRDIGTVLGVSYQRAHQLVTS